MGDVKFGRTSLGKPIPANIAFWCRVISAIGGFMLIAIKTAPFIGPEGEAIFEWIIGAIVGILNVITPFFGVDVTTETVPAEKVASIETETKS